MTAAAVKNGLLTILLYLVLFPYTFTIEYDGNVINELTYHSMDQSQDFNILTARNLQYIYSQTSFKMFTYASCYRIRSPISRYTKNGCVCLVLPSSVFVMDLTICLDVSRNPGPNDEDVKTRNQQHVKSILRSTAITSNYSRTELQIPVIVSPSRDVLACRRQNRVNFRNLMYLKLGNENLNIGKMMKFCAWNAQSVCNKTAVLQEYLCDEKIDLCAVTESWITENQAAVRVECTPPGYSFSDHPRTRRVGGGIAVIYRSTLSLVKVTAGEKTSFEFAEYLVSSGSSTFRLIVVYRTPYSQVHRVNISTFLEEFAEYMESIILTPEPLLVTGDINIHVDVANDPDAVRFLDLIDSMGLVQHVKTSTHRLGHTLDLIITRETSILVENTPTADCCLSDHFTVLCNLTLSKPSFSVKEVSYRKLKGVDIKTLKEDLQQSDLCREEPRELELGDLVSCYNSVCSSLLDKHAPIIKKTITVRPRVPWFNDTIKASKRERRKYERVWRATGLESDKAAFNRARNHTNHVIEQAKREYYTDFINENSTDQRHLFNAVNRLLGRSSDEQYPPHVSPKSLANDFGQFFARKIANIRSELDAVEIVEDAHVEPVNYTTFSGTPLTKFESLPLDSVKKLIISLPAKSCEIDPIPTSIVKECLSELSPTISTIINTSLEQGRFPDVWKGALVKPRMKKIGLELQKKNFRPVNNLQYLSKLTEKVVAEQMTSHIMAHGLFPEWQSAYRQFHSTETALLRVRNDILLNMNKQHVTLLVCLDLSAAFETIEHTILLQRLENKFGFGGTALQWIREYLSGRFQQVIIDGVKSDKFDINIGVPQGSCLGPLLFSIYTSQLFEIVGNHLPTVHGYADDTQLYLAFGPDDSTSQDSTVAAMEGCIKDLRNWMIKDKLKLNDDKTEFILIGTRPQLEKVQIDSIVVGDDVVSASNEPIRNLGAWFDRNFTMSTHVTKICKAGFFYLYNISRIRKYLSLEATETLVHAFVTSRLDYCNALLYGLPNCLISKLQRVQNAAARLIFEAPRYCHITPLLTELHWLNVKYRIEFKMILITYKAIYGKVPEYICKLISLRPNSRYGLRSNNKMLLKPLAVRTWSTLGDRAFACAAPRLWNELPLELREEQSITTFKWKLKTYLFKKAYYD